MTNKIVELNQKEILAIAGGLDYQDVQNAISDCYQSASNAIYQTAWDAAEFVIIPVGLGLVYWAAPPLVAVITAHAAAKAKTL